MTHPYPLCTKMYPSIIPWYLLIFTTSFPHKPCCNLLLIAKGRFMLSILLQLPFQNISNRAPYFEMIHKLHPYNSIINAFIWERCFIHKSIIVDFRKTSCCFRFPWPPSKPTLTVLNQSETQKPSIFPPHLSSNRLADHNCGWCGCGKESQSKLSSL